MAREWDWERVNWEGFDETIEEIGELVSEAQKELNAWVEESPENAGPEERLYNALDNASSALVALHHVVNMHHELIKEERKK